ncbi:MAG TPA: undecaprenyl diphosphate synthase family protein [Methanocorpusculum sp.]|nr:undecaprenyl diphosphate synthase family protein [Methanocorpusculum sp.]
MRRETRQKIPKNVAVVFAGKKYGNNPVAKIEKWVQRYPEIEKIIIFIDDSFIPKDQRIEIIKAKDGQEELCRAIEGAIADGVVTEESIEKHLLHQIEPDLVIIVGSNRLQNVLIWQSVYAELAFIKKRFTRHSFLHALNDFRKRVRRFGK